MARKEEAMVELEIETLARRLDRVERENRWLQTLGSKYGGGNMKRAKGGDVAIFTRNHRNHLEQAVSLSAFDPTRQITFRARSKWVSALDALNKKKPRDLYISPVGGDGIVEYVADLYLVHLDPQRGQPVTEELLKLATASTADEGLWEHYEGQNVQTLYVVSNIRKLEQPFPMTKLVKVSDNKPIRENYGYSYCLVYPYDFEGEK